MMCSVHCTHPISLSIGHVSSHIKPSIFMPKVWGGGGGGGGGGVVNMLAT